MPKKVIILTGQGKPSIENEYRRLFSAPIIYQVRFLYALPEARERIFSRSGIDALVIDNFFDCPDEETARFIVRMKDEGLIERMKVAVCSSQTGEFLVDYASLGIQYFTKPIDLALFREYFNIPRRQTTHSLELGLLKVL